MPLPIRPVQLLVPSGLCLLPRPETGALTHTGYWDTSEGGATKCRRGTSRGGAGGGLLPGEGPRSASAST